jgi:hypothetical protein
MRISAVAQRQLVEHTDEGPVVTSAGRVAKLKVEWATDRATLRSIGACLINVNTKLVKAAHNRSNS